MNYSLDEIKKFVLDCNDEIKTKENKTPGSMNIIELMNRNHLENQHSNVIAYLINPDKNLIRKHPEYGYSFLEMINKKLKETKQKTISFVKDCPIYKVITEYSTSDKRRIDILIETEDAFIIIENKIKAEDQPQQMFDYVEEMNKVCNTSSDKSQLFCVYLTLSEREISEESFTEAEKAYCDGYINLTYTDLLEWIKSLKTRTDEEVLNAALIQYRDVLEGLLGKRKQFNREKIVKEKMISYFFDEQINHDINTLTQLYKQLPETQEENELWQIIKKNAFPLVIYIQFILNLKQRLLNSEDLQKKNGIEISDFSHFKLFCTEQSYEDNSLWLNAVKQEQKEFGIEWQSPIQGIKCFFMFANEGKRSACSGYSLKLSISKEQRKLLPGYKIKNDKGIRTENFDGYYINYQLLGIYEYNQSLIDIVLENCFLKTIKNMKLK